MTAQGTSTQQTGRHGGAAARVGAAPRLFLLAGVTFIVGTNSSVIAGLLPQIAHDLGTDQATVSYSVTLYALIVAAAAPLVSTVLARVPRGVVMAAGCGLFAAGTVVAAGGSGVAFFLAGRAIAAAGGAALVPLATAVGASLVPPAHKGRALATVGVGFTVSGAFGAPLGTIVGSAATWRLPLLCLAGLAVLIGAVLVPALRVRATGAEAMAGSVACGPGTQGPGAQGQGASSAGERTSRSPLGDKRVVFTILSTWFMVAGFNAIVIFSARLFSGATGGSGSRLAVLLMAFGIASIFGNSLAGPLTDKCGNRVIGLTFLSVLVVLLIALSSTIGAFPAALVAMSCIGLIVSMVTVPVQHRLLSLDPDRATQTLAWNSTAMYLGIAASPVVANLALSAGGAHTLPLVSAGCVLMALGFFALGYVFDRDRSLDRLSQIAAGVRTNLR